MARHNNRTLRKAALLVGLYDAGQLTPTSDDDKADLERLGALVEVAVQEHERHRARRERLLSEAREVMERIHGRR